jgi:hypothetical protein
VRRARRLYLGIGYLVFGALSIAGAIAVAYLFSILADPQSRTGAGALGLIGVFLIIQGVRTLLKGEQADSDVDINPLDQHPM